MKPHEIQALKEKERQKEKLKKLRAGLPAKWQEALASQFNLAPEYVHQILLGNRRNRAVYIAAVALHDEYRQIQEQADKYVEAL